MASVGLANNFAALKALASEGIQRGHMSLHAKNIWYAIGIPIFLTKLCINLMTLSKDISYSFARKILNSY